MPPVAEETREFVVGNIPKTVLKPHHQLMVLLTSESELLSIIAGKGRPKPGMPKKENDCSNSELN